MRAGASYGDGTISAAEAELEFLEQLYRDYRRPLYALAYSYTRDRGRATEVVQDVMWRAWSQRSKLSRFRDSPKPWLFTVARNLCADAYRAKAARPEVPVEDETIAAAPALAHDDICERMVEAWSIKQALAQLSPEHRAVIQQIYFEDRSTSEIAQRLGIPPGTVASRAFYAVRRLRAILAA